MESPYLKVRNKTVFKWLSSILHKKPRTIFWNYFTSAASRIGYNKTFFVPCTDITLQSLPKYIYSCQKTCELNSNAKYIFIRFASIVLFLVKPEASKQTWFCQLQKSCHCKCTLQNIYRKKLFKSHEFYYQQWRVEDWITRIYKCLIYAAILCCKSLPLIIHAISIHRHDQALQITPFSIIWQFKWLNLLSYLITKTKEASWE